MRNSILLALILTLGAGALVPGLAAADVSPGSGWSVTLSAWGGVTRYDVLGLKHGVSGVESEDGKDLLDGNFNSWGGSAVLRLGWLDLGALYEGALLRSRADSTVITPLVGFAWDLSDLVRLDLLGELGGHRVSNIGTSGSFDVKDAKSVWLPYVGVRPTLSLRLPVGPTRFVLSATPFARWDLVRKQVAVTVASGGTESRNDYDVGGSTFGLVGGVGLEF
jgi:hypothetical protein